MLEADDAGKDRTMPQYMLSVHSVEGEAPPSQEQMNQMFHDVDLFNQKLQQQGAWVFADALQPATTAKVVRSKDGRAHTTDGPFATGKEHLGGFWVINAPDLQAALSLAGEAAAACQNPVEVRPFQEMPQD